MRLITCQTFGNVVCCIRCIKKILICIKFINICGNHRLCSILCAYDIFEISVFDDKCQICLRSKISLKFLFKRCWYLFFKSFATCLNYLLWNSCINKYLTSCIKLLLGIHKLHIQKLFHCSNRSLAILIPKLTVITKKICSIRELKLIAIFSNKHLGLSHVRIIIRLK